ncbi:MBL fold metallo-hydrolase [Haloprofundus salilacus]|uniref:MBL fold metallo-hydrolase n=1 Tax=Haloprofundus salilacus TaxID=2876190 RepID=UPI001CCDC326|nr:MBL fold metallo-hydrolase [Haloprofundus salilacus]
MTIRHDGLSVEWLGYATVRIETPDGFVVYLDPGRYGVLDGYDAKDGDLVCVSHIHHYDSDGIERVAKEDATVVAYGGIDVDDTDRDVTPLSELDYEVVALGQEDRFSAEGADVWTLPAYNEPDGPHTRDDGEPYHPEGFGVGYLLSVGGRTVFWPGDSDVLEGHEQLEVSLFLPPIGGAFTMDREEAAGLAETLDPDLVLPIHYDTFEALETDSSAFAADVASRGVPVVLDER